MGDLRSIRKEQKEAAPVISRDLMNAVLDHLRTNQLKPQPCTDGAIVTTENGWSCHVRVDGNDQCVITRTPRRKKDSEHAMMVSSPCAVSEVTNVILSMTTVEPIRRDTEERVENFLGGVIPGESHW